MVKINFKGLVAQWKNRYRLLPVAGAANLYDLVPERGTVTQEGDEITAEAMNQLQANVEQAIDDLQENVAQDMADLEAASGEALKQAQLEADSRYSNALTGTASGAMAHMTDVSSIGSLRRLAVLGETTETGTGDKGPDHPYAVDGITPTKATACGKNILSGRADPGSMNGISWTVDEDGAIHSTGTATAQVNIFLLPIASKPYFWIDRPIYTSSDSARGVTVKIVDKNGVQSWSSTDASKCNIPLPCGILSVYFQYGAGDNISGVLYPYLGLEPNQPYQPYKGADYPLPTLDPLYGDGEVNDEYDAATGTETRRWKRLELDGTENSWRTGGTTDSSKFRYILEAPDVQTTETTTDIPRLFCTHYPIMPPSDNWLCNQSASINYEESHTLLFYDDTYNTNDLSAWKSWLAAQKAAGTPVTVVYRLAEPVVTQRDPARVIPPAPVCNVYADQGDVDVTYNRDINMAFAALETATQQLEAIENGSY